MRVTMDDDKRSELGTAKRREVLGDAWVDNSAANKTPFNAEFLDLITRYAWSEIWTRDHFDERSISNISCVYFSLISFKDCFVIC